MEQRKVFFEEGYLIIENLLSSQEIEKCQNEIERLHLQCKEFLTQNDPRKNHFQMEMFFLTQEIMISKKYILEILQI